MRIRSATPHDLDAVARLLTQVFLSDPLMKAMVAPAPDPGAALDHLHRVELSAHYLSADPDRRLGAQVDLAVAGPQEAHAIATGWNESLENDMIRTHDGELLLGVTLWDPPGATDPAGPLGPGEWPPTGLDLGLLGGAWDLVLLDGAQCEAARPTASHWYLYMIAVSPLARGKGVGSALLRQGLGRVDADGTAAHLESTTPASRRLYALHGFRQVAELTAAPLPTYWAMTRPAGHRRDDQD